MFPKYIPTILPYLKKIQSVTILLFRPEYKPHGYYLEHFWQADLGYIGQAKIGVEVPNRSHVACIQHGRVCGRI